MAQVSRPFQILLVVSALFIAVWFLALRGHSSTTGTSSPSTSPAATATVPVTPAHAPKPAESKAIYHGSAPGVEGLSRAIARAHGAVAESQENGKRLQEKAAAASSPNASSAAGSSSTTASTATPAPSSETHGSPSASSTPGGAASTSTKTESVHVAVTPTTSVPANGQTKTAEAHTGLVGPPTRQLQVERVLKEGKIAVILFWNPKGADDAAVAFELKLLEAVHHLIRPLGHRIPALRAELKRSGLELEKKFVAFDARANEVTSFGSITRGVQVYGTPTILVVNTQGRVITITGLTDAYAIEQAIDEARHL